MKKRTDERGKAHPHPVEPRARKEEGRRRFLDRAWAAAALLAGLETVAAATAYLFSGKPREKGPAAKQLIEAGPADSFLPGTVTPFRGGRFYLARLDDGGYLALSLRCTHLGCSIVWEEKPKRFVCPCHASSFDLDGSVRNPPAPRALDYYPVVIDKGIVKVDVGAKTERARFDRAQAAYPGT
jgi:cytochrome b6-f complex iron-sulfur subunit